MVERLRCLSCGHIFPRFPTDRGERACPACGSTRLEANPWLLGTPDLTLTADDHWAVALQV
ncbi:MAG: hydrogenase maturation nickel metallochaperone HypA [Dehalococcoidia bacterium]|nr:hydrogenase maturation nickel metallochaperone HypA [Dehalococcoidia bacterium]MDW8120163.1 hypothetical protein [Chloroflexota bacterium]